MLNFDAVIFDMDGVITRTAAVHSLAWKKMFDEYLHYRKKKYHEPFHEFTHAGDYLSFVDGRPRYQGVDAFLKSRGINLPFGKPEDESKQETVCGLGNRKNELFNQVLEEEGVGIYDSTVKLIKELLEKDPDLSESIKRRNPYIDPLSFVQVELIKRVRKNPSEQEKIDLEDAILMTINGIAAGLKNTG